MFFARFPEDTPNCSSIFHWGLPSSVAEAKFQHELSGARQGLRRDLREAFGAMNAAPRCMGFQQQRLQKWNFKGGLDPTSCR